MISRPRASDIHPAPEVAGFTELIIPPEIHPAFMVSRNTFA
jgi:hypothetical protein